MHFALSAPAATPYSELISYKQNKPPRAGISRVLPAGRAIPIEQPVVL
jgi:hypothetical protein